MQKRQPLRLPKLLKAAKGAPCLMRSPACNSDSETVVACHLNESFAGKGMGQKADDTAIFYACSDCHRWYDEGGKTENMMEWVFPAVVRTMRYIVLEGVLK